MDTDFIVCGLGNPGPEYRYTRHNLGFWVTDLLCERFGGRWRHPGGRYVESRIQIAGKPVILLQPLTFMNLSGLAVRAKVGAGEGFDPKSLLVVCDDTALPLGRLRLRSKGSDGGHNGLGSIIEILGTRQFPRLRLGVGPVPEGVDQADFVLSAFQRPAREKADEAVASAADCVETCVLEGVDAAMTRFNVRGGAEEVADGPGDPKPPTEGRADPEGD